MTDPITQEPRAEVAPPACATGALLTTLPPFGGAPVTRDLRASSPAGQGAEVSTQEPAAAGAASGYDPALDLGPLFHDVQLARVFPDSKSLVDARPRFAPADIVARYAAATNAGPVDLKGFVQDHFELPLEAG